MQKSCGEPATALRRRAKAHFATSVPRATTSCKRPMLPRGKLVNADRCAAQYFICTRTAGGRFRHCDVCAQPLAHGLKSYWVAFPRNATFCIEVLCNEPTEVRRSEREATINFATDLGSDSNMSTIAATSAKAQGMTKDERFVIFAS